MYDALIGFSVNPEFLFKPKKEIAVQGIYRKKPYHLKKCISGTSFDVAYAMQQMGKRVKVLGAVGRDDPLNYFILKKLPKYRVELRMLYIRKETPLAWVDLEEERQSRSYKPPIIEIPKEEIKEEIVRCQPILRIITGLGPNPKEIEIARLFWEGAKEKRVLNPSLFLILEKNSLKELLGQVDLLILNDLEAGYYFNKDRQEITFKDLNEFHELGVAMVIVTLNVHGAILSTREGEQIYQPKIQAAKLVDETGAGDCFLGVFLSAKLEGKSNKEAMKFAAAAAALKVTCIGGSSMPKRKRIEKLLESLS